jgi:hypothetical protein
MTVVVETNLDEMPENCVECDYSECSESEDEPGLIEHYCPYLMCAVHTEGADEPWRNKGDKERNWACPLREIVE